MTRQRIVVDTETTGLRDHHVILEVGAVNLDTGEEMSFAPYVPRKVFGEAEPDAMRINRYFERGVYNDMLSPRDTRAAYDKLSTWLKGNTLAGANPTFDAAHLASTAVDYDAYTYKVWVSWHHRLWDVSAHAAGKLGLDELPGLNTVCELLGVENEDAHSALGDARATAECFRRLEAMPRHIDIAHLHALARDLKGLDTRGSDFVSKVFSLVLAIEDL